MPVKWVELGINGNEKYHRSKNTKPDLDNLKNMCYQYRTLKIFYEVQIDIIKIIIWLEKLDIVLNNKHLIILCCRTWPS